jgi:hypothetical protein
VTRPKLLFDECIGKPHVVRLAALVELEEEEYRPTVEHVLTCFMFVGQLILLFWTARGELSDVEEWFGEVW